MFLSLIFFIFHKAAFTELGQGSLSVVLPGILISSRAWVWWLKSKKKKRKKKETRVPVFKHFQVFARHEVSAPYTWSHLILTTLPPLYREDTKAQRGLVTYLDLTAVWGAEQRSETEGLSDVLGYWSTLAHQFLAHNVNKMGREGSGIERR